MDGSSGQNSTVCSLFHLWFSRAGRTGVAAPLELSPSGERMFRSPVAALIWASAFAVALSAQSPAGGSAPTGEPTATPTVSEPAVLNPDKPRGSALATGWVRIRVEAPVRILRDPHRIPLTVLKPDTKARVRDYKDGWLLVEFDDKRWGKRLGWVLESQCEW